MDPEKKRLFISSFGLVIALTWTGLFSWQAVLLGHRTVVLHRENSQLEVEAERLTSASRELVYNSNQIRAESREFAFLQGMTNLMPQEKSFMRTQKAIGDEVSALREKVGRRMRNDVHILVDTKANKLYVKKGLTLMWEADCSVGRGGFLSDKKTGRRWEFVTPHGKFEVLNKMEKPLWIKPDWAFVETGEAVPPPEDPARKVEGELGGYVLNLGDGYLIHGTKTEQLLGRPVSHGCVRLGAENLKKLYELIPVGTKVFIF